MWQKYSLGQQICIVSKYYYSLLKDLYIDSLLIKEYMSSPNQTYMLGQAGHKNLN